MIFVSPIEIISKINDRNPGCDNKYINKIVMVIDLNKGEKWLKQ